MKIFKRSFVILSIIVIIGSLSFTYVTAKDMIAQFNETKDWENSSLLSQIHQVPPAFAENYISNENQKMLKILTDINVALDEIKKDNGILGQKVGKYWELHDFAKKEISESEEYKSLLNNGIFKDFSLYLNADKAINDAYENLQIDNLQDYEEEFAIRLLRQENQLEKTFLEKLQAISKDYANLEAFSKKALNNLGVINESNVLEVNLKVNQSFTDSLIFDIEKNTLTKFAHIRSLLDTLKSDKWTSILAHNDSSAKYYSWKESQKILEGLMQSNYVKVSTFKTVEDVLAYNKNTPLQYKANHTINSDSAVTEVYYDGSKLSEDLYVKRGTPLSYSIDYQYTEDPKSIITVEYLTADGESFRIDTFEDYVGKQFNLEQIKFEGYVISDIKGNLNKFPSDNSTIKVIYEEFIPEPEPEPEPEIEPEPQPEKENDSNPKEKEEKEDSVSMR